MEWTTRASGTHRSATRRCPLPPRPVELGPHSLPIPEDPSPDQSEQISCGSNDSMWNPTPCRLSLPREGPSSRSRCSNRPSWRSYNVRLVAWSMGLRGPLLRELNCGLPKRWYVLIPRGSSSVRFRSSEPSAYRTRGQSHGRRDVAAVVAQGARAILAARSPGRSEEAQCRSAHPLADPQVLGKSAAVASSGSRLGTLEGVTRCRGGRWRRRNP